MSAYKRYGGRNGYNLGEMTGKVWKVICYEVISKLIKHNTKATEVNHGKVRKRGRNKQTKNLICRDPVTVAWLSHIKEGKVGTGRNLWLQFLILLFCFQKISSDQ